MKTRELDGKKGIDRLVCETSVWNFHGVDVGKIMCRKGTNLYKAIEKIAATGYTGMMCAYVDAIGRSGHSASRVSLYKGCISAQEYGSRYYSARYAEVRIENGAWQ